MKNKLEFLGLKNNPFYSKELKDEWLELFINRKQEIERTFFYIDSARTTAVCSKKGIGKSSFLSYLNEKILPKENILSLKFNFDFEKIEENEYIIFLRKVLLELLNLFKSIMEEQPQLKKIDYSYETSRLHKTITFEESLKRNFGGKFGIDLGSEKIANLLTPLFSPKVSTTLGGDKSKEHKVTTQVNVFNNEEIKSKIIELGKLYDEPIVFFIDELDKTGKLFQDNFEWAKQIYLLLRHCREIFESSNFIFVFALDAIFYDKKIAANIDKDDKNIDLFGIIEKFVILERFPFSEFKIMLQKRLNFAEVEDIEKFLDETKLKLLYYFARANSRRLISWYEEVLFSACIKKNKDISVDIFFDVFENEINLLFSKAHREFFIKLITEKTVSQQDFPGLNLDKFIEHEYVIKKDDIYYTYN